MSQSLPMTPGIGFPADSQVDLLRKLVWNTYFIASITGSGGVPSWVTPPAASNSAGTAGHVAYDSNYLYVAVANATWRRIPLNDW